MGNCQLPCSNSTVLIVIWIISNRCHFNLALISQDHGLFQLGIIGRTWQTLKTTSFITRNSRNSLIRGVERINTQTKWNISTKCPATVSEITASLRKGISKFRFFLTFVFGGVGSSLNDGVGWMSGFGMWLWDVALN